MVDRSKLNIVNQPLGKAKSSSSPCVPVLGVCGRDCELPLAVPELEGEELAVLLKAEVHRQKGLLAALVVSVGNLNPTTNVLSNELVAYTRTYKTKLAVQIVKT